MRSVASSDPAETSRLEMAEKRCGGLWMALAALLCLAQAGSGLRVKRIINGRETDLSESTWLVSMQAKIVTSSFLGITTSHKHAYCGGTLISDRWILTAAHCFDAASEPNSWHARFASENIEMSGSETLLHIFGKIFNRVEWKQLEYHAERIVIHPGYSRNRYSWPDDIALVKLKETIPLSLVERVSLIELAGGAEELAVGQNCSVYGWGCAQLGSGVQDRINRVDLPLRSDRECYRIWSVDMSKRVCAGGGSRRGIGSACQGDSGGPLICRTATGDLVQTGIVSFIHKSAPTMWPVVFTEVSAYKDWIDRTIDE